MALTNEQKMRLLTENAQLLSKQTNQKFEVTFEDDGFVVRHNGIHQIFTDSWKLIDGYFLGIRKGLSIKEVTTPLIKGEPNG